MSVIEEFLKGWRIAEQNRVNTTLDYLYDYLHIEHLVLLGLAASLPIQLKSVNSEKGGLVEYSKIIIGPVFLGALGYYNGKIARNFILIYFGTVAISQLFLYVSDLHRKVTQLEQSHTTLEGRCAKLEEQIQKKPPQSSYNLRKSKSKKSTLQNAALI